MSLTPQIRHSVEIAFSGGFPFLQIATFTDIVDENGQVVASGKPHRTTCPPGGDVSGYPDFIQAAAAEYHNDEVISTFEAQVAATEKTPSK